MQRDDFLRAFEALGARLGTPTEIVVAGGSALVLLGIVVRSFRRSPETSPRSRTTWTWRRRG